jgi:hypothetical protein
MCLTLGRTPAGLTRDLPTLAAGKARPDAVHVMVAGHTRRFSPNEFAELATQIGRTILVCAVAADEMHQSRH